MFEFFMSGYPILFNYIPKGVGALLCLASKPLPYQLPMILPPLLSSTYHMFGFRIRVGIHPVFQKNPKVH